MAADRAAGQTAQSFDEQVRMLGQLLGETIHELQGEDALGRVEALRRDAIGLRRGKLEGGRAALASRIAALDLDQLEQVASAFTNFFHLMTSAEEQNRIRVLRSWDRPDRPPPRESITAALSELKADGAKPAEVQALLDRLLIMPVLTAHPTEARRRTVLDHLEGVSAILDRLDDPRPGERERAQLLGRLREAVMALACTPQARASRPTPLDEVQAALLVFERSLLEVTPGIYRELEQTLARTWPGETFRVGTFLRWGTWVGGDRDGNPYVTAEVTRAALDRQRALAIRRHLSEVEAVARELSVSARLPLDRTGLAELEESLEQDRERLPEVAARAPHWHAAEPWREKLRIMAARLQAAQGRAENAYPDARAYLADLQLLERTLVASGLSRLASGRLRDARRSAEVFGFHLATLDLRQHSGVHEKAVAEILSRGGIPGYQDLPEEKRTELLGRLLSRSGHILSRNWQDLSPATREALETLEVVGRARREISPRACERYIVSFTRSASDLLEVLFLARTARLASDEIRPVPLLEQLEDLDGAAALADRMLELDPIRNALGGELEVMIGYSDSSKQAGYVASNAALYRAQVELARVAESSGATLTIFHGRGGAVGRGGGPANRAIRAQPAAALRGRFRVTEQGETIAARYGRPEIARRDLEQMVHAVLVTSWPGRLGAAARDLPPEEERFLSLTSRASKAAYDELVGDRDRLTRYALAATPIELVSELPIGSRPASRGRVLTFQDLRAIPWVFSWAQSRQVIPGWFGLGAALEATIRDEGMDRLRERYRSWPFFRALIDNARLALIRSDMEVASFYARLADPGSGQVFELIRSEYDRTARLILEMTGEKELLEPWPTLARTTERRNPYVDVLSHTQVELLRRLRQAPEAERDRIRAILFVTLNGIAAGIQTVG